MDRCANTEALDRYLSGEEQYEQEEEMLFNRVEDELNQIHELIEIIMTQSQVGEYDFGEQAKDWIKDLI